MTGWLPQQNNRDKWATYSERQYTANSVGHMRLRIDEQHPFEQHQFQESLTHTLIENTREGLDLLERSTISHIQQEIGPCARR